MSERNIQADVQLALGSRPDVRLFRNNTGAAWQGERISCRDRVLILRNFRLIHFGLVIGGGDLIGWRSFTVTPDMVGRRVAVFLSVEDKTPIGRASPAQLNWADQVRASGGLAGFARSVPEAINIVDGRAY
jgi:hypothetical protein